MRPVRRTDNLATFVLYDMIYLTATGLTPGDRGTVHMYTQRHNTKNNTMKQNTNNGTYIAISIGIHNKKNT